MESLSPDPTMTTDTDHEAFRSSTAGAIRSLAAGAFSSRRPDVALAHQRTLASPISCVGTGLHTGAPIALKLSPAPADTGIVFQRTDIAAAPLPARFDSVVETRLSTVLGDVAHPENRVATIEHLMAALHGRGIDNAYVSVSGPETPVLDGSSADFLFLIDCAGVTEQNAPRAAVEVLRTIRVEQADAFAELAPSRKPGLFLSMTIDFSAGAIGHQSLEMELTESAFRKDIAFSRTFTDCREIDALRKAGLGRGGSLDNAIVVDGDKVLNPAGLRARDEFVRHKVLDAIGDLWLAGAPLQAKFTGHKSGHNLNNRLLRALFADPTAWRAVNGFRMETAQPRQAA